MTHGVWMDGDKVSEGTKSDCERIAVFLRTRLREADEKVAGRVGVHPLMQQGSDEQ